LSAFFLAVCGWIDLKFGRDLHVDLLFQFLFFFFSTPPLIPPSPPSPPPSPHEIKSIYILKGYSEIGCLLSFEKRCLVVEFFS
jgi:hypothetical protein